MIRTSSDVRIFYVSFNVILSFVYNWVSVSLLCDFIIKSTSKEENNERIDSNESKENTVACLAAGLTLVGTAGLINYAAGNPYESYKSVVVNTIGEDNLTAHAAVQMKQNGKVIASGNAIYEKSAGAYCGCLKNDSDLQEIQEQLPFPANVSVVRDSMEYPMKNDKVTYYVCKNHVCLPPANHLGEDDN